MEIELNVTLKGMTTWRKGLILNDEEAPFPDSLLKEIKLKTGTIKILKEKLIRIEPIVQEPTESKSEGAPEFIDPGLKKKITKSDIIKMNKESLVDYINDTAHLTHSAKQKLITYLDEKSYRALDMKRKELIDFAVRKLRI